MGPWANLQPFGYLVSLLCKSKVEFERHEVQMKKYIYSSVLKIIKQIVIALLS